MPRSTQPRYVRAVLALLILWSHSCLAYGRYRYSLAVEKAIATFSNVPRGGEQRPPKFWSIFKKLADAKEEATIADAVKKDSPRNPLYLSNKDGRGGAMMVKKSRTEIRVETQYLKEKIQPVDDNTTSEVEPAEENVNVSKEKPLSAMARLGWVNLRNMADPDEDQVDEHDQCTPAQENALDIDTNLSAEDQGSFVSEGTSQNLITDESNKQKESGEDFTDDFTEESGEDCPNDEEDLEILSTVVLANEEEKPSILDIVPNKNNPLLDTDTVFGDEDASLDGDVTLDDTTDAPETMVKEVEVMEELPEAIVDVKKTEYPFSHTLESVNHKAQLHGEELVKIAGEGINVPPNPDLVRYSAAKVSAVEESPFISSGHWTTIDKLLTLGLAKDNPSVRVSRHLRPIRKAAARATGMHGLLSGKSATKNSQQPTEFSENLDEEDLGVIQRRIAAIDRARAGIAAFEGRRQRPLPRIRFRRRESESKTQQTSEVGKTKSPKEIEADRLLAEAEMQRILEEEREEQMRKNRVLEIDRAITEGQKKIIALQSEKDAMQRRPNPLYNYSTVQETTGEVVETRYTRKFNFPKGELVDEYLEELFANGRLVKMNHTYIWKSGSGDDENEDESIGDDLFTPSAGARKLYQEHNEDFDRPRRPKSHASELRRGNGGGGSWLLRQTLGQGSSLGEKIGESVENLAYKSICAAVMASLAKSISAIHGINIMTHSDIRVFVEDAPDLPPLARGVIPDKDYAQKAIVGAMREGSRKRKKKAFKGTKNILSEDAFIQRDAIVETLISHCQISAPLLKLFPLEWQRALLGNIITLIAAIVSDFCDGIQLQILGHQLSFSFKAITESDMIRHIGMAGNGFNHRRARPEQFEAAVRATAEDVSAQLSFLDRWHERALGSGMLRAQVANLIARIVLTLADEVLSGARMDLWSAQAGGPRLVAGLEYRTNPETL